MLKVYSVRKGQIYPVTPSNNIYSVVEGYDYILEYWSNEINVDSVFIEDIPISPDDYEIRNSTQIRTIKKKFFIDYFGYACLKIDNNEFIFNIKVEKFKLNEIEEIFTFLWSKEESLFNNFFSKSTKKIKFDKSGIEINNTSKYILFANYFVDTFEEMLLSFKYQPHTKLKEIRKENDFSISQVTQYSIDWLFRNLDTIRLMDKIWDNDSEIKINGKSALIEKIGTEEKINSFNTYENSIIIGALYYLKKEIQKLKKGIASIVNVQTLQNKEFAEFSDLKKIPFLQMYHESTSIEKKCNRLAINYQRIFNNVPIKIEKPQLTSVFSSKIHYRKAYKLIKNLYTYKFILDGEFRLLNITKLSQLYEVYNFHILNDSIKEILSQEHFDYMESSSRTDGLTNYASYINSSFSVKLYYEDTISNGEIVDLVRIDNRNGSYYKPDYILEVVKKNDNIKQYWIFDSKYSKQAIVKTHHINDCVFKYILNTGVKNNAYQKVEGLAVLFPSGNSNRVIESNYYKPTIDLIISKPKSEFDLFSYLSNILRKSISKEFIRQI